VAGDLFRQEKRFIAKSKKYCKDFFIFSTIPTCYMQIFLCLISPMQAGYPKKVGQ
jgi:hypothetical protein